MAKKNAFTPIFSIREVIFPIFVEDAGGRCSAPEGHLRDRPALSGHSGTVPGAGRKSAERAGHDRKNHDLKRGARFFYVLDAAGTVKTRRYLARADLEKARLYGLRYILDFMADELEADEREKAYRLYVADALRYISENTANASFSGGYFMQRFTGYDDMKIENRTAEEIVEDVTKRAGITVVGR